MTWALLATLLALPAQASEPPARDWLRHIVERCLEPQAEDYCGKCLRPAAGRCGETPCAEQTVVWSAQSAFVALRDRKMCGCPEGFVHGLALPRARVSGVEDPARPDGIWEFAWSEGRSRLPASELLLAVNAPFRRSQDQLHVHIQRLLPDGRTRLEALAPERVEDLGRAWAAAERHAKRLGLTGWYGVAAAAAPSGGWWVAASASGHPETEFGIALCK